MHTQETEILVVGAGPVGLWTALLASQAGLETVIVDREERTAARSYACALHARSLRLLERAGLLQETLALGRKVHTIAFYEGPTQQAELDLAKVSKDFPFLLLVPQNALEGLLQARLKQAGCRVEWNHRFDGLEQQEQEVTATIEELAGTSTGYIVPHWETVVKNRIPVRAQFLVGADGHRSLMRERLGLQFQRAGDASSFAAYEFETKDSCADEVRVVLDGQSTNVLWPLPENRYRWTFQILDGEFEFPEKERRTVRLQQPELDEQVRQYVQRVAGQRAPWFQAKVEQVTWCSDVAFEPRLAGQFGRHRAWLAGDAAHQTGPVGVQSMNAGLAEAEELVSLMRAVLKKDAPLASLNPYDRHWQTEWRRLLAMNGALKARKNTSSWPATHASALLSCLPGTGEEVPLLAGQLGLEWA